MPFILLVALMPSLGCSGYRSDLNVAATSAEARTEGCDLQLHPAAPPPYRVAHAGTIEVECVNADSRRQTEATCVRHLVEESCRVGMDTAMAFQFTRGPGTLKLRAVLGTRAGQSPWPTNESCSPSCSPGFVCNSGLCVESCEEACAEGQVCRDAACVSLCNPGCAAGYECDQERTCVAVESEPEPSPETESEPTPDDTTAPEASAAPEPTSGASGSV